MRIDDRKQLYVCHNDNLWFYHSPDDEVLCPECNRVIAPFVNRSDRHREECMQCKNVFEVAKKSPYENSHFLNCDTCMTVLKISYNDSVLHELIDSSELANLDIGQTQVTNYWKKVEKNLINCLCGGQFRHENPKKCPICLKDVREVSAEYTIVNDKRNQVVIPVISRHIWKKSPAADTKHLLEDNTTDPLIRVLIDYFRCFKYLQEIYFEKEQIWADSLELLKSKDYIQQLANVYSFEKNEAILREHFTFSIEVFPDTYHFIAFPLEKSAKYAYLLQGKTGFIEIHPAR